MAGYGAYVKVELYEGTGGEVFSLVGACIIWGNTAIFVVIICS